MSGHKIVEEFEYKGRKCVVIEINKTYPNEMRAMLERTSGMGTYCNGYVEIKKDEILESYDDYNIESDELTYQGDLKFGDTLDASEDKTFIGFDSAHSWNDDNPKSKTKEYVANTCRKIVDELLTSKSKNLKEDK